MFYGLDTHQKFIQVCHLDAHGKNRRDFKIDADRLSILKFAQSLGDQDAAVLESTFHRQRTYRRHWQNQPLRLSREAHGLLWPGTEGIPAR